MCVIVPCPEMIRQPENVTTLPGHTADFYCLALSYSGLLYRWNSLRKTPIISNTTTTKWLFLPTFSHYTAVQHLSIGDVKPSDEGWYCCEAINECGRIKECAWLEVLSE